MKNTKLRDKIVSIVRPPETADEIAFWAWVDQQPLRDQNYAYDAINSFDDDDEIDYRLLLTQAKRMWTK